MNNHVLFDQVVARLDENGLRHTVLSLQGDARIIVAERGGRIFGPFLGKGESLTWMSPVFADPKAFSEYVRDGNWNLGGERIWIAPEFRYMVRDRKDFWKTVFVPSEMDPGTHALDASTPGVARLSQTMDLETFNPAQGRKMLRLEKVVHRVDDPLAGVQGIEESRGRVAFAGYRHAVTISEDTSSDLVSAAWDLLQMNPGGEVLIPAAPRVSVTDYYEPVGDLQTISAGLVRVRITGTRRFKAGYKAAHHFGRVAYLNDLSDGRSYLLVRSFYNDPSAGYFDEPANRPGCNGSSIQIYNDDGSYGGFGELECQARSIGGSTGRSSGRDPLLVWLYVGPRHALREIAAHLVGAA